MLTFFGKRAEDNLNTLKLIFQLIYRGGFDFKSVWQMPVLLRDIFINELYEALDKESKAWNKVKAK